MRTLIDSNKKREIIAFNKLYDHSRLENRHSFVWYVLTVNHEVTCYEREPGA